MSETSAADTTSTVTETTTTTSVSDTSTFIETTTTSTTESTSGVLETTTTIANAVTETTHNEDTSTVPDTTIAQDTTTYAETTSSQNVQSTSTVSSSSNLPECDTCTCNFVYNLSVVLTDEQVQKLVQIKQNLTLDKTNLSSWLRTKISAKDDRPTSTGIGALGIILLCGVFVGVVVLDLTRFMEFLSKAKNGDT